MTVPILTLYFLHFTFYFSLLTNDRGAYADV